MVSQNINIQAEIVSCEENFLHLKSTVLSAKENEIPLRKTAGNNSIAQSQGYQKCHCKCLNNRYTYRAEK